MIHTDGVALVTGAGSGIGRDCAMAFAADGASGVAFADVNLSAAQAAAEESRAKATHAAYRAVAIQVDVSSPDSVDQMVQTAYEAFGRIDYSVNSAGVGVQRPAPVSETDVDEFDRFYHVNVRGVMLCVRAVSRRMQAQDRCIVAGRNGPRDAGRGSIVNVASANSIVAFPAIVQYTAAKHAVLGITKTAAIDLAADGIRVNTVCPSWVQTPMIDQAFAHNPDVRTALEAAIPAGRFASVEEVSDAIVFLSGPRASYVTGVAWLIDGGTTLQMKHV